ncbi:MAG: nucleotidyltransferase family protein [Magnetococcales bacterium]|nr:nucleotidyltransferase family protein [Magnetococcales bacterium]
MAKTQTPGEMFLLVWKDPTLFPALKIADQDLFLRMARRAGLISRFANRLDSEDFTGSLSPKVQNHLQGARMVAQEDARMLRWEVNRIKRAFLGTSLPVILLKGAAYLLSDLPMARGRLVADVDILCHFSDLAKVEELLTANGWQGVKLEPYDQRYYRDWMHELPPMRHKERLTEVDIHHAILPRTGRLNPDSTLLLADKILLPGEDDIWTLSPVDMALHGVVHLFYDSDFDKGLRGLTDLDGLFRHFGQQEDFWQTLIPRARQLNLARPLYYAVQTGVEIVATPVPAEIREAIKVHAPSRPVDLLMQLLIRRMMVPNHPEERDLLSWLAWLLLFIRSHWLRMPPGLLLSHLTKKWVRKWRFDVRNRRTV